MPIIKRASSMQSFIERNLETEIHSNTYMRQQSHRQGKRPVAEKCNSLPTILSSLRSEEECSYYMRNNDDLMAFAPIPICPEDHLWED
eukprot:CAMPEP_0118691876 /NCGR_PEP_ID=MMETSP0800-20121206/10940_1 /TAXON_ID=210618 ORGANISM="Striatella unipunctata, Strain CCMP2910" /NCGR_SAMPLE_ID=MMETSP0800 /ASSEMBLY_ACC=CAM_ASM_000638 /LENGTH=87 /DNA_ID=CAMNT_0006589737 /DNA_START=302 /DNA_END=565 /DNA_ORIENTATION=+